MSDGKRERLRAFEAIVGKYESPLLHYAARLANNAAFAEDIVQNAFVRLARSWKGGFADSPVLSAWLYRTVHNEAVDLVRSEERRRRLHREHGAEAMAQTPEDAYEPGAGEPGEDALAAARALETLSPRERQAVVLKVYEEKTYREIAEIMGISADNVGVTLNGAMKKLSAMLEKEGIRR